MRQKAIDILLERMVAPKDYVGEVRTLFEWVQRKVRYTKDPFRLEVLHSARRMLELRAGDCDDMSILLGAMLEAIGHPVRIVVTGPDPLRRDLFTHVYLEAFHRLARRATPSRARRRSGGHWAEIAAAGSGATFPAPGSALGPLVPGVGPVAAAAPKVASPVLREAGVTGYGGLGALYQAPDGPLCQMQGIAQAPDPRVGYWASRLSEAGRRVKGAVGFTRRVGRGRG